MSENPTSEAVTKKKSARRGDRIEVIKVLVLAVVSFVLGFGLVVFFLGPKSSEPPDLDLGQNTTSESPSFTPVTAEEAPSAGGGYAPGSGENPLMADQDTGDQGAAEKAPDEGDAPSEVPPGRTPEGVGLKGDAFYLKCWDSSGAEVAGSACDRLTVLEKRFSTRLYVVDKCKQQHAGEKSEGKLSLGVEVNFDEPSISYWNGASSDIDGAAKIATCLRDELAGLPIHSMDHKHSRYRLFFTVIFGKGAAKAAAPTKPAPEQPSDKPPSKGKTVDVIKDQVRVRKTPVDGDIIGKISSGNQVRLVGQKQGWCEIITPNNNRGWMICDALSK
jgi:hypothetical protein